MIDLTKDDDDGSDDEVTRDYEDLTKEAGSACEDTEDKERPPKFVKLEKCKRYYKIGRCFFIMR